ncbi:hypothetical protein CDIK_1058 [Cucumispora dikerogammari]|nr:hypothetical protein CDIK_1058 [Cucumispora dikerogammari]
MLTSRKKKEESTIDAVASVESEKNEEQVNKENVAKNTEDRDIGNLSNSNETAKKVVYECSICDRDRSIDIGDESLYHDISESSINVSNNGYNDTKNVENDQKPSRDSEHNQTILKEEDGISDSKKDDLMLNIGHEKEELNTTPNDNEQYNKHIELRNKNEDLNIENREKIKEHKNTIASQFEKENSISEENTLNVNSKQETSSDTDNRLKNIQSHMVAVVSLLWILFFLFVGLTIYSFWTK